MLLLALPILWFVVATAVHERIYQTLPPEEAAEAMGVLLARQSWIVLAVGIAAFLYTSRWRPVPALNRAIILMFTATKLQDAVRYTWAPDGTPLALRLDYLASLMALGVILFALARPAAVRVMWAGTYAVLALNVACCISLLLQ